MEEQSTNANLLTIFKFIDIILVWILKLEFGKKILFLQSLLKITRFLDVKKSLVPTKYVDNIRETVEN